MIELTELIREQAKTLAGDVLCRRVHGDVMAGEKASAGQVQAQGITGS